MFFYGFPFLCHHFEFQLWRSNFYTTFQGPPQGTQTWQTITCPISRRDSLGEFTNAQVNTSNANCDSPWGCVTRTYGHMFKLGTLSDKGGIHTLLKSKPSNIDTRAPFCIPDLHQTWHWTKCILHVQFLVFIGSSNGFSLKYVEGSLNSTCNTLQYGISQHPVSIFGSTW